MTKEKVFVEITSIVDGYVTYSEDGGMTDLSYDDVKTAKKPIVSAIYDRLDDLIVGERIG